MSDEQNQAEALPPSPTPFDADKEIGEIGGKSVCGKIAKGAAITAAVVAALTAVGLVCFPLVTSTLGAQRSTQLRFQQRQAEIRRTIDEQTQGQAQPDSGAATEAQR